MQKRQVHSNFKSTISNRQEKVTNNPKIEMKAKKSNETLTHKQ